MPAGSQAPANATERDRGLSSRMPLQNGLFLQRLNGLGPSGRFTRLPCLQRILPAPEPERIDQPTE